jgi:hypothetical protein
MTTSMSYNRYRSTEMPMATGTVVNATYSSPSTIAGALFSSASPSSVGTNASTTPARTTPPA